MFWGIEYNALIYQMLNEVSLIFW